uniref:STI1 domain-containing protein n=1 Tax=Trieres chinensis TaxID=1514140 RepID=A0A7S2A2U0_TRICV|mmetsp:Transcript_38698/g.78949  ORF Transcript_38698/g.78949 Transcript_38698/m.78949 type:complete len:234 (+) Transcript_38698:77-778(+)|eukprot:CAMPEP_0183301518 /NCGR_PEP_ID=MMETSP0160_2-20130417/7608_1 /TAXON_ID=2839 ORGANISM="Odontella Sinensis, Strain Grunow 1884" /NCGR_SAMPLE_ID=MMETSP0160_2 /ASSEMBLY_ACC=CAM_ASM_000250 /LENGTH=233 /DNA_ID=CAMNT_0025464155 /DNA_START=32 /DNA_END=733 /DNA_ORIENTATION=-
MNSFSALCLLLASSTFASASSAPTSVAFAPPPLSFGCASLPSSAVAGLTRSGVAAVTSSSASLWRRKEDVTRLGSSSAEIYDEDDDEEDVEPGKMKVSEIKAELEMRGVRYADCFDRESLEGRLLEARSTGRADPSIVDAFNQKGGEGPPQIDDDVLQNAVGGDGTLPGGMPPDMLKKLMSNPELMGLLQSPKMQEGMKLMMTEGQEALEKAMAEDRELYEVIMKLNKVMAET